MTFLSFAQNFEDIVLWRALSDVGQGFYIDVGANDPIEDSVTKAFYDRNWHGINVEPVLEHYDALMRDRPRDINLPCALGEKPGRLMLYEIDARGLSTNAAEIAERYRVSGRVSGEREVEIRTLEDVCLQYVHGDIHFLKIDVEGFERNVLLGADFTRFRPWILVIESTEPNSPVDNSAVWESIVIDAGYEFAYFDGLNRFYVAAEHIGLKSRLALAPNVFDQAKLRHGHCFVLDPEVPPDVHRALQAQLDDARRTVDDLDRSLNEAIAESQRLQRTVIEHRATEANLATQVAELQRELTAQRTTTANLDAVVVTMQRELASSLMINELLAARACLLDLPLVRAALKLHGKSKSAKARR